MMEEDKLGGFQFWPNYYKASKSSSCPKDFAFAIIEFFYEGKEPMFENDTDQLLWDLIKPSISCSKRNSERRKNGGGAHAGNNYSPNGRRGKDPVQEPSSEQVEGKDQGQQDEAPKPKATKGSTKAFVPPTVEDVEIYAADRGFLDPKGFARYYLDYQTEAKWTMSNGRKIKNWKLNVIQWEPNNKNKAFSNPGSTTRRTLHERQPDYI